MQDILRDMISAWEYPMDRLTFPFPALDRCRPGLVRGHPAEGVQYHNPIRIRPAMNSILPINHVWYMYDAG